MQPSNQDTQDSSKNTDRESDTTAVRTRESTSSIPNLPIETRPTIRPVLVWVFLTIFVGSALVIYISRNVEKVGGPSVAEVTMQVVAVIAILIVIRFAIRAFILTRTTYEVGENYVRREYTLLLRTRAQIVPTEVIRSIEMSQSRVQKLMGYGTISMNKGLGDIRLENLRKPHETHGALADIVDEKSESNL